MGRSAWCDLKHYEQADIGALLCEYPVTVVREDQNSVDAVQAHARHGSGCNYVFVGSAIGQMSRIEALRGVAASVVQVVLVDATTIAAIRLEC